MVVLLLFLGNVQAKSQRLHLQDLEDSNKIRYNQVYEADLRFYDARFYSNTHLDWLAQLLKENLNTSIYILTHTDNCGSPKYNEQFSKKKAENVKRYLVRKDSSLSNRIITRGYGMRYPLNDNSTDEKRAANRRTEIVFINIQRSMAITDSTYIESASQRIYDLIFIVKN